ncbi:HtaA domain-containing protein [Agrococcus terreus]|uniref:HtaA domain-containing protein n=1 Tax=Agrococcus terreus TaxID=574649 RepID=UPI00384A6923
MSGLLGDIRSGLHGGMHWGIKASLLAYVRRMPDGAVSFADGAADHGERGIRWAPGVAPLAFRGRVTLTGHGGLLRVTIADPSLVEVDGGWALEVADPDDPALRLRFATIEVFDGERASGTALTEDGADLFFGPYERGTPIDDPVLEA